MKRLVILVAILLSAISVVPLWSCTCDDTQDSSTFIELLKLFPADTLSNGEIILINYSKIWKDAGISFINDDGTKMNREEINDEALSSLMVHIGGEAAFDYSSFYTGMDKTLIISPIQYDTLGYTLMADVDAEIICGDFWIKT